VTLRTKVDLSREQYAAPKFTSAKAPAIAGAYLRNPTLYPTVISRYNACHTAYRLQGTG